MIKERRIERYIPTAEVVVPSHLARGTTLEVDGETISHFQTLDFPISDPWSRWMRGGVIAPLRRAGSFLGLAVTEFGIGDGRNIREVGKDIQEVTGVDVEEWRLQVAGLNLVTGPASLRVPVDLWWTDAVEFSREFKQFTGRERLSGWVIMCLPQSPEGLNTADRYDGSSSLNSYRAQWDRSGLTLNAATLDNLRAIADSNLRTLVILSDRVPPELKIDLIHQTGWQVDRQFQTPTPIQQDPDTGIHWVAAIDDGQRFYEQVSPGKYDPISAVEAETRRQDSIASGQGRDSLNVYHHLTVYQLSPRRYGY